MNIAIAGYGVEGESNYNYWNDGKNHLTIFNEVQPDKAIPFEANIIVGEDAFSRMDGFDLVVRTAGLAPRKIKTDSKIWSGTNEFFEKCPAKIIGVTGSKGKGTTASLIASMLEQAGYKVWLVGNIGKPALDVLPQIKPEDVVIYELSSFQLWDLEKSPFIAVVLFIEQEHLDVHKDIEEYISAKANITKYQTSGDILIYNSTNRYSKQIAETSNAQKIAYQSSDTAHVKDDCFWYNEQKICSVDNLGIVGKFNYDNACAAIDTVWVLTHDAEAITRGLNLFKGLPHRLEFVREIDGVRFYDDSIATIPGASIAAISAFDEPKVMIIGGSYKGADFNELATALYECPNVKVILIGEEAIRIKNACDKVGFNNYEMVDEFDFDLVVKTAKDMSVSDGVVLLSPACASFGLFKNYSERGDKFKEAVNKL